MIFELETASATAIKPRVGVFVGDTAGGLLLDLRRGFALWGSTGGRLAEWTSNPDALW
jgi:hypothetical protein